MNTTLASVYALGVYSRAMHVLKAEIQRSFPEEWGIIWFCRLNRFKGVNSPFKLSGLIIITSSQSIYPALFRSKVINPGSSASLLNPGKLHSRRGIRCSPEIGPSLSGRWTVSSTVSGFLPEFCVVLRT